MRHRRLRPLRVVAVIAVAWATAVVAGQALAAKDAKPWKPTRTAWGDPDLQGVWNYAAGTPLERPAEFSGKAELSEAELARAEQQRRDGSNMDRRDGVGTDADVLRENNEFWFTRRATILTRHTSLITNPPDGKLPAVLSDAAERQAATAAARRERGPADSWTDRSLLQERCLVQPTNGPPILPGSPEAQVLLGLQFNFRILQSPGFVAILSGGRTTNAPHPARWPPASSLGHPPMARRLAGPLGRQHPGRRDHESSPWAIRRRLPGGECPSGRAVHPQSCRRHRLSIHGR